MRRLWCWFVGHAWRPIRVYQPCNVALAHLHPLAAADADCERCGAQWRDFDAHEGHHA